VAALGNAQRNAGDGVFNGGHADIDQPDQHALRLCRQADAAVGVVSQNGFDHEGSAGADQTGDFSIDEAQRGEVRCSQADAGPRGEDVRCDPVGVKKCSGREYLRLRHDADD
jgi:hypothetical protein